MATTIATLSAESAFELGDIPSYVKTEAYNVAQKVRAVQTNKTITSIVWADAHHTAGQVTGWQAQTNISTLHAAMGIAAIAAICPIDIGLYAGDYTFGNGETTLPLFEEQVKDMNKMMDLAFGSITALYAVGNHDTGEYYLRDNSSGALYGANKVYELIGSRNDDGTTTMGSTAYGYCYRDLNEKKCRIICLNTVEGETTEGYNGSQCSDTQLLWFAQRLYEIGNNNEWSIIVVSHYPLDYGATSKAGNIVYQYINGGKVTYNGTTVNFSNHNFAKFAAQYHGHTHCLKAAKLNYIVNNTGTEFDAWRLATPSGTYYRNNDYANSSIYGINFGETQTYPKTADSGKDTAFVVNVYNPEIQVIYSFCYGAGYDRVISIGGTIYHTVTTNLTHCSIDNINIAIEDNASYTATITPDNKYNIGNITITMGGIDITNQAISGTTININNVNGDIIITAIATKIYNYTNLVPTAINASGVSAPYEDNKSINSSGSATDYNGFTLTGFIPLASNNTNHIYRIGGTGITWNASDEYSRIAWYDSNYTLLKSVIPAKRVGSSVYYPSAINTEGDLAVIALNVTNSQGQVVSNVPTNAAYFRVAAKGTGANLIITLDQIIDEI